MIPINDISLTIFIIAVTISLYYLFRVIRVYLREINLMVKKESLENQTLIRDIDFRVRKLEEENKELKRIITELGVRKKVFVKEEKIPLPSLEKKKIVREGGKERFSKTEKEIIKLLFEQGGLTSREIRERLKLSREHVARTLKKLFEEGYLERDESIKPFKYVINNAKIAEIKEYV